MNLEIQYGSTYTFTFTKISKNLPVNISTATIEILDPSGNELLAETNMSISGNVATYSWDSSDNDVACNYLVKYYIDEEYYNRFFDIYYYPFISQVNDDDLLKVDDYLRNQHWEISGRADSGTTLTLVDKNIRSTNDKYNGGILELYFDDKTEVKDVSDYDNTTYTITFTPASTEAVSSGLGYCMRKSYQELIDTASEIIQDRFQQIEKRAYLLIDHSQTKWPIIYQALSNFYKDKRKEEGDEYDLKYNLYEARLAQYMESIIWKYDADYSGLIDQDGEDKTTSRVQFFR